MAIDKLTGLVSIFRRFESDYGLKGVAIGPKEKDGVVLNPESDSITFFVSKKLPREGSRQRLSDGRRLIPNQVSIEKNMIPTDVLPTTGDVLLTARNGIVPGIPSSGPVLSAGGPVSNNSAKGTFGCLVTRQGVPFVQAVTNKHVAIERGNVVYFPSQLSPKRVSALVSADVGLVPDEKFTPFQDKPNAYFDVDAALITIPNPALKRFSPKIPTIGTPKSIYKPNFSSFSAYRNSLIGLSVMSWGWRSRRRNGRISHIFYVTRSGSGMPIKIYSFIIKGVNVVPGLPMDSGKIWATLTENNEVGIVGLHQGIISSPVAQNSFAVATEMWTLARMLRIKPYVNNA